jgi:hypothetical protein
MKSGGYGEKSMAGGSIGLTLELVGYLNHSRWVKAI